MSLGIKSLWRAQSCAFRLAGLSLIPREQYNPLFIQRSSFQRWFSASTGEAETSLVDKNSTNQVLTGKSLSNPTRALYKQVIKRFSLRPKKSVLVKPPAQYISKRKSRQSLHESRRSAARQHLYDHLREAASEPASHWRWTLNFMLRHTRDVREILNFRVIIGKGVAAEARRMLSEPDTDISQICRRNECDVRIEETSPHKGTLILNLSGSEHSVRKSLVDIIGVVGKITAVRVFDPIWKTLLLDAWKRVPGKRPEIRLLGNGKVSVDDRMMTLYTSSSNSTKYKDYRLTRRADEISRPTVWTKDSLEKYVAALVHGQVPTYLAQSLYPNPPPDHQGTVVSLLADLFTSEHTKSAISLSALKMAINFIESRGAGYRHVSRSIFSQVELLDLPMDADIFNTFLVSASKARNLDSFNTILRSMVRKGHAPQGRAWVAFMEMIQSPTAKQYIAAKLRTKGLNRNSSIHCAIGRQMAVADLEHRLSATIDIQDFVNKQNRKYGRRWLDTITLNRILDVLGEHGHIDACNDLLDLVYTTRIARPNTITLNIILTHTEKMPQLMALKSVSARWPKLALDDVSYHLLFRAAWKRGYPNMLRVIWRYAALARSTTSKMRLSLTKILTQESDLSRDRAFMKAWEDVIFGRSELTEMRTIHLDRLTGPHMISNYIEQAKNMRPSVSFATKLEEAHLMDLEINRLDTEGTIMTTSTRESLSVEIPLEPIPEKRTLPQRPRKMAGTSHNRRQA
ncbi:hypothetical protein GGS26DRAFT_561657 [Hypomontagnella submonticulosa]|nr:hypothetical protein GGS26DRAFT_561657 [Hypomontagnella submonticulosa]